MSDLPAAAEDEPQGASRSADLLGRLGSPARKAIDKLYDAISRGWENQDERARAIMDWWDCYNCHLSRQQFYNGNASIYVPIVRDAIDARATRFTNQLFPPTGRYVDVVSSDGKEPFEVVALVDYYIRLANLKNSVVRPLCVTGDVEGQYNLYVDWTELRRQIVSRETRKPVDPMTGAEVEGEEMPDVATEDVTVGRPAAEVLHDTDVLVWPATADTIDEALAAGGGVAIVRRWSKAKIEKMIAAGEIRDREGGDLLRDMTAASQSEGNPPNLEKRLAEDVGITKKGQEATVWEVWTEQPLSKDGSRWREGGERRLCRAWLGPNRTPLGLKRNPFWNDLCPLLSRPVKKVAGVFKGASPVAPVAPLQYEANDAANQGADQRALAAFPVIRADPQLAQPPFVYNNGAIWKAPAGAIEMLAFPDLTPRAIQTITYCTQAVFTSLGVNPAMIPGQTGRPGAKRNQAEIALEQQVDMLTTAEATSTIGDLLTDLMGWFVDLDHQFRDRELAVRMFGEMGMGAEMQSVPVLQNGAHYQFSWSGAQQAQANIAWQQQGAAWLNILRGLRQDLAAEGYQLKLAPIVERGSMNVFGATIGAQVLIDQRRNLTMPAELEDTMLADGFDVPVHPLDPDPEHIQRHQQALVMTGDPHGTIRVHLQKHLTQAQGKAAMMVAQAVQQAAGAGGQAQGRPQGQPQPGAQPAGPRLVKGPPGMVRPDNMPGAGALTMPRRT